MHSRITVPWILQVTIAVITCGSLSPFSRVSLLVSEAAQNAGQSRQGKPRAGRPEGNLPDLEAVQNESHREREPAPPIPSTMRSPKLPLQPWDGRRVGDPGTGGELGQARNRIRRAHASRRASAPPPGSWGNYDDRLLAVAANQAGLIKGDLPDASDVLGNSRYWTGGLGEACVPVIGHKPK